VRSALFFFYLVFLLSHGSW